MKSETERLEETLERERLRVPSLGKRIVAYFVDDLLITLLLLAVIWGDIMQLQEQSSVQNAMAEAGVIDGDALMNIILTTVPLNLFLTFMYHWLLIARFGATIGKMLCRIRVVDIVMLDNPSYWHAAIRSAIRLISVLLYFIPFISVFTDPFLRGFHDRFAKSVALAIE